MTVAFSTVSSASIASMALRLPAPPIMKNSSRPAESIAASTPIPWSSSWFQMASIFGLAARSWDAAASPPATVKSAATLAFTFCGLTVFPKILRRLQGWRHNLLVRASPVAYVIVVLLAYAALAGALNVTLVFAAFLAGVGVVGGITGVERQRFAHALDAVARFAAAFFIPIYFAFVGYKLDLGKGFSAPMLLACTPFRVT